MAKFDATVRQTPHVFSDSPGICLFFVKEQMFLQERGFFWVQIIGYQSKLKAHSSFLMIFLDLAFEYFFKTLFLLSTRVS